MSESELIAYWSDLFLEHNPPAGGFNRESSELLAVDEPHPDKPDRVANIKNIVEQTLGERTEWKDATPATREQLTRVHTAEHLDDFEAFCEAGGGRMTAFTGANEESYPAAVRAAGAALEAAERSIESGLKEVPYALVRPSGHHAQADQVDGYCFLNNVAVAAEHLRATGAAEKVAIIDWDVHHGNGTQQIFYDRDDVLFVSLHADHRSWGEWHPQTGLTEELGTGAGEGYNLNVPLPHGSGDDSYAYAFRTLVEPVIAEFSPDAILVSAGQDPGSLDPMARNVVTMDGFREMGSIVRSLAEAHADGHLALIQEGGYQPSHLAYLTLGCLEGALNTETSVEQDPYALWPEENLETAVEAIHRIGATFAEYWPVEYEPSTASTDGE